MLEGYPLGVFSRRYAVTERGQPVAELSFGSWSQCGSIQFDRRQLTILKESWWRTKLRVEESGSIVARAAAHKGFRSGFSFAFGDTEYALDSTGMFSRAYQLSRGGQPLGIIRSVGVFSRRAHVELPDELPLEVRLFALWLVLLAWHSGAAAAAAAS